MVSIFLLVFQKWTIHPGPWSTQLHRIVTEIAFVGLWKIPYCKASTIVLQRLRKPGTNYFDSIAQSEYNGKNVDVYKTNFFTSNFKSTLFITLLKAKLLTKIIEMSIGNKKICSKEKKVILLLVNIYHILLAHILLWYRYGIFSFSEELCL